MNQTLTFGSVRLEQVTNSNRRGRELTGAECSEVKAHAEKESRLIRERGRLKNFIFSRLSSVAGSCFRFGASNGFCFETVLHDFIEIIPLSFNYEYALRVYIDFYEIVLCANQCQIEIKRPFVDFANKYVDG